MPDLTGVFAELRAIMRPYADRLDAKADSAIGLYLDTRHIQKNKQPLFFGAVQIKKNYVSYYLMPLYVDPTLVDGISASLRKRMQGKSCFNFTVVDPALFQELATLTEAGYAKYAELGYV